ncbi:MAG: exosortase J [Terracidiphilus sp.]
MAQRAVLISPVPGGIPLESARPAAPSFALWFSIAFLTAAGCLGIYRELLVLWSIWTTDPLRSIGMLIPPAAIVLTLLVWRRCNWELRGTWWGLLVIALSYFLSLLRLNSMLLAVAGRLAVSFIPVSLPVYIYASGVILLFAGARVWRNTWFPLGLLLLCQPVPILSNGLIDIPLQDASARVARSFATLIGLVPTTPQLRLMFSPDFGMFIAPGCDGIRGAVTMGYVALIFGYLKRVSIYRWIAYVSGAVLLGYLFNFIRLCFLVLYYRVALGHPALENMAKQADYVIGSCLFLVATLLFMALARYTPQNFSPGERASDPATLAMPNRITFFKCVAFAATLLSAFSLPSSALSYSRKTLRSPESLAVRMPRQVGAFTLTRTWYEQQNGNIVVESGAYSAPGSGEIILGVWVAPLIYFHDAQQCWLARGLQPETLTSRLFVTAGGKSIPFSTGFYNDGVTDSIVVTAACTPSSCTQFQPVTSNSRFGFLFLKPQSDELSGAGAHPVSIMLRIDQLHSDAQKAAAYGQLSDEAQKFLAGLDITGLSRAFQ